MHQLISQLFSQIEHGDEQKSSLGIVALSCVLEHRFKRWFDPKTYDGLVSPELIAFEPTEDDLTEIFDHGFRLIASTTLRWPCRVSLAEVLGHYAPASHLGVFLSFLTTHAPNLNEQFAYSLLATLGLFMQRTIKARATDLLKKEIQRSNLIALLSKFDESPRLKESVIRLSNYIQKNLEIVG